MQALATLPQYDPALKDVDGLTAKQRAFCDHYIELNSKPQPIQRAGFGTEAARRAGYQGSDQTLGVVAFDNLKLPKIREYIRRQVSLVAMPADEVLKRLSKQARADVAQVLNDNGEFDFVEAKKRGNTDLIRKLKTRTITRTDRSGETETEVIHELELHNAQTALELMAKHHHLLDEKETPKIEINIDRLELVNTLQTVLSERVIDVTPEK